MSGDIQLLVCTMSSFEGRNFSRQKESFLLAEKKELGKLVAKCKDEYDEEVKALDGKTVYNYKRKKHVTVKPRQGFVAVAVRRFYADLSNVKHNDPQLVKALKLAQRCYDKYLSNDFPEGDEPPSKRCREEGGGRKSKAPEVREAMFEWFIDVRGTLKGRLPIKMFRSKCQTVYADWLKQQPEPVPEEEQLKFQRHWIKDWMSEYSVSLRKPNKRFAISKEDRVIRIQDYFQNIWMVRKYFMDTYGIDPPVINGDQMPLHRNESASQKTLTLKSEPTFVKENYMLLRERTTCFTQLCSDPKVELLPEFVFKGKGTRTTLYPPAGVNYQWAEKGSYRIENITAMIDKLPNRYNIFTAQGFAIYVLDDYAVHLMPEVRNKLYKRGYVLVVIGGSIPGDVQVNDTDCHHLLKVGYRDLEMELMLAKLEQDPKKIPAPSRDDMMSMLLTSWQNLDIDTERAFKSVFVTNALDGSEDYLVSDKLFALVGEDMVKYRDGLMKSPPSRTLKEVVRKLIPPKGIKRRANAKGCELFDCEDEEMPLEELVTEEVEAEVEENVEIPQVNDAQLPDAPPTDKPVRTHASIADFTDDPDIRNDSEFLDNFQDILSESNTSTLFIPFMSQFRATYQKARRSLKKRVWVLNQKPAEEGASDDLEHVAMEVPCDQFGDSQGDELDDEPPEIEQPVCREYPEIGQHWEVAHGSASLYAVVVEKDPYMAQFYVPSAQALSLNEVKFEVLLEDFVRRVEEPQPIPVGRSRVLYTFV